MKYLILVVMSLALVNCQVPADDLVYVDKKLASFNAALIEINQNISRYADAIQEANPSATLSDEKSSSYNGDAVFLSMVNSLSMCDFSPTQTKTVDAGKETTEIISGADCPIFSESVSLYSGDSASNSQSGYGKIVVLSEELKANSSIIDVDLEFNNVSYDTLGNSARTSNLAVDMNLVKYGTISASIVASYQAIKPDGQANSESERLTTITVSYDGLSKVGTVKEFKDVNGAVTRGYSINSVEVTLSEFNQSFSAWYN